MSVAAFRAELATAPPMSLRGGNALDEYREPPPFDEALDAPNDQYLENYYWGLPHLDPASWRHYLPFFIDYALRHMEAAEMPVDTLLFSLRPPDREPPRFGSLSADQRAVVVALLDHLAFDASSVWQAEAMTALEEYWGPDSLYGPE